MFDDHARGRRHSASQRGGDRDAGASRSARVGRVVWMAALSACTIAALGIQTVASFGKLREAWPFLDYPMYRTPRFVGDEIPHYSVVARLEDGRTITLDADDCGLNDIKYRRGPVAALRKGDVERLRLYLLGCDPIANTRTQEVILMNAPLRLAAEGVEPLAPRIERSASLGG